MKFDTCNPINPNDERAVWVLKDLEQQNSVLRETDRQNKYNKMACSAFHFYRGTNHLFWADFAGDQRLKRFGNSRTKTWIQGDLHALNFGTFDNDEGEIVYDLNDFDESLVEDYQYDLWRLAVSLILMTHENGKLTLSDQKQILEGLSQSYLNALAQYAENPDQVQKIDFTQKQTYGAISDFLDDVEKDNSPKDMLKKWTALRDEKPFLSHKDDKLGTLSPQEKDEIIDALPLYYESLKNKLSKKSCQFNVQDIARRLLAGIGSLGTPRYYILLEDHKGILRILDVKRQSHPTAHGFFSPDEKEQYQHWFEGNEGKRHQIAYKALSQKTDDFLGWLKLTDGYYSVRQRSPYKEAFDTRTLTRKTRFVKVAQQWGTILATAHSRGDRRFNPTYVPNNFAKQVTKVTKGQHNEFKCLIHDIALGYANQVEADWRSFRNFGEIKIYQQLQTLEQ